jgi:hypothetical protein
MHAPVLFEGVEVDGQVEVFLVLEVDEASYCADLLATSGSARNVLNRVPFSKIRVLDPEEYRSRVASTRTAAPFASPASAVA